MGAVYESQRIQPLIATLERITHGPTPVHYSVTRTGFDKLDAYWRKGFVFLPRHERYSDVPLYHNALRTAGERDRINWVMNGTFPRLALAIMKRAGGIVIPRVKDIPWEQVKELPPQEKDAYFARLRESLEYTQLAMKTHLQRGEVVTVFPQGERWRIDRHGKQCGDTSQGIRTLLNLAAELGEPLRVATGQVSYAPIVEKMPGTGLLRERVHIEVRTLAQFRSGEQKALTELLHDDLAVPRKA